MWKRSNVFLIGFLFWCQVFAQQNSSPFKYADASALLLNGSLNLDWYGDEFYYRWDTSNGASFYRGRVTEKQAQLLFSEGELKAALTKIGVQDLEKWKLYRVEPTNKKNVVQFSIRGVYYHYDWKRKKLNKIDPANSKKSSVAVGRTTIGSSGQKFNVDSTAYFFVKENQLFLKRLEDEKEIQLSDDGEVDFSFSSINTVWVGDYIVSWREDRRAVDNMMVINSLTHPAPTARTYKFPMPGDAEVAKPVVEMWDLRTLKKVIVPVLEKENQRIILPGQLVNGRTYLFAPRLGEDQEAVFFLRRNRGNDEVELCRLQFSTGEIEVLIKDTARPHINEQLFSVHVLNETNTILFWSERTGFGKYYRYDLSGNLLNRVGPDGDYVAGGIKYIDTLSNAFFMDVYGFQKENNPYLKQVLRVNLDQENGRLLTDKLGVQYSFSLSDNKRYFLSQYSDIGHAPIYELRDTSGRLIMALGEVDMSALQKSGWKAPEQVEILAQDGETMLYGLIYTPRNYDPTKKYPVITSVYPGPQDDFVPHGFTIDDNYHQSLADEGFVVVQVPSRGSSPYRGLKFHSYSYGNMRDYPLEDNKYSIEALAKDRPYMDLDRVGIYGHSGGGFMSATAILTYPKFYKVAVAASGNYDPNIYTQWWGETYHGLSPDGKKGYIPTAVELAPNLEGKLLLITGDVDVNVHPANTLRLADALIKANKYFDMMVLPGKGHGLGDAYYQNLIHNYFNKHLTN